MMTRQDFEAIAEILADNHPVQGEAVDIAYRDLVDAFMDYFESINWRFDRKRFLTAAGYGD